MIHSNYLPGAEPEHGKTATERSAHAIFKNTPYRLLSQKAGKSKKTFESLGYLAEQDTVRDEIRKVDICFLIKDGYRVELVSPFSEESVVSGLLKKYKNAPYHICYEADDPETAYEELTANGFAAIDTPTPAPALNGCKVVFLTSPVIGMIELIY